MFTFTIDNFPNEGISESWMSTETRRNSIGVWLLNMFSNKGVGYLRHINFNNRYDGNKLFYDTEQTHCSVDVALNYFYHTDLAKQIQTWLASGDLWYWLPVNFGKGNHVLRLSSTPPLQVYSTLLSPSEIVQRCAMLEDQVNNFGLCQSKEQDNMAEKIAVLTLQLEQEKKVNLALATINFNLVDKLEETNKIQSVCLSLLQRQVNDLVDKLSSKNLLDE